METIGVRIGAHIASIAGVEDSLFNPLSPELAAVDLAFPVLDPNQGFAMRDAIEKARKECDSVGGVIQCAVTGLPAGLGEPMFGGMESKLAQILYGIPAVKGVEFGAGFAVAKLRGSQSNDAFRIEGGRVVTASNRCGGILGGITNGMPLLFQVAIKPTPSISRPQDSVSLSAMENRTLEVKGRHDPCIVPRAVPVVEAAAAIALCDLLIGEGLLHRQER